MIAALVLAGVCASPPLFDMSGPACANPMLECGCSECARWDPVPDAERYEVLRHNPDGTTQNVGTSRVYENVDDETGFVYPGDPQELWCFAKDPQVPQEGQTYVYEVRACSGAWTPPCGPWSGTSPGVFIPYVAAPYWCWRNGAREACQ